VDLECFTIQLLMTYYLNRKSRDLKQLYAQSLYHHVCLYLVPFGPLVIELLAKYLQKHDDNFVKIVLQYNTMTLHAWKVHST
jgi:hypothetical protein